LQSKRKRGRPPKNISISEGERLPQISGTTTVLHKHQIDQSLGERHPQSSHTIKGISTDDLS